MSTSPDAVVASDSSEPEGSAVSSPDTPSTSRRVYRWLRLLPELVTIAFCVVLYTRTLDLHGTGQGPGPAMYPRILIVLLAVTMLGRIVGQLRAIRREASAGFAGAADSGEDGELPISLVRVAQVIALSVGFVIATVYLGWVLATFLFVPLFCWACGKRNLLLTVPLGAGLALGSAYVFVRLVYIALPTGVGAFDELTVQLFIALGIY